MVRVVILSILSVLIFVYVDFNPKKSTRKSHTFDQRFHYGWQPKPDLDLTYRGRPSSYPGKKWSI